MKRGKETKIEKRGKETKEMPEISIPRTLLNYHAVIADVSLDPTWNMFHIEENVDEHLNTQQRVPPTNSILMYKITENTIFREKLKKKFTT